MIIALNDPTKWNLQVNNVNYQSKVRIVLNKNNSIPVNANLVNITFEHCVFEIGVHIDLDVSQTSFSEININFVDCIFRNSSNIPNVVIKDSEQKIELNFSGCVIDNLFFEDSKISYLFLSRTLTLGIFRISESFIDSLHLSNCLGKYFHNDIAHSIVNIDYSDSNILVSPGMDFKELYRSVVKSSAIKNIFQFATRFSISNPKVIQYGFDISNSQKKGLKRTERPSMSGRKVKELRYVPTEKDIDNANITLKIMQTIGQTQRIQVENGVFSGLEISGNSESVISIQHVTANNIFLDKLKAQKLNLYNIKAGVAKDSKFQILDSTLENTYFVLFNSFHTVNIYRSAIEDAKFSGVRFPATIETLKNIHYPDKKDKNYMELQYDLYRQLRVSLVKNSNIVQALEMQRRMFDAIEHTPSLSCQDKFILWTNKWSNDHETSITSPLLLTMLFLICFWFLYCLFLPNLPFNYGWYGLCEFLYGIKSYFVFATQNLKVLVVLANPVHSVKDLSEILDNSNNNKLTFGNYIVSFFSRIFIGWTYYQFISAFRKFGKKL